MKLTPYELDKLSISTVARSAQDKLALGLVLNYIECKALICRQLQFLLHKHQSVAALSAVGQNILGRRHILKSAFHLVQNVQLELCFADGVKLVTVHGPFDSDQSSLVNALYGSSYSQQVVEIDRMFLQFSADSAAYFADSESWWLDVPGAIVVKGQFRYSSDQTIQEEGATSANFDIELNKDRPKFRLKVTNEGDRPVQIGSHFVLVEANPQLRFNRRLAFEPVEGCAPLRLDILAGTAVRFEPGESKTITCVPISGYGVVTGGNGIASPYLNNGQWLKPSADLVMSRVDKEGFYTDDIPVVSLSQKNTVTRQIYAHAYGPTTGDIIRLADTNLYIEIERDLTAIDGFYGDECVFGGGKTVREGMAQCNLVYYQGGIEYFENHDELQSGPLDLCITNCIIVDYSGIYKADVGVKDGNIIGIGKAGNLATMKVHPSNMIIGACTEIMSGEGKILTAGGVDTHVHFICPQLFETALSSGITTLIGGGTGPNTGTCATTCTPGKFHIRTMLQATDHIPMNIGFTGKGNCSTKQPLIEQIEAGAVGLKLHEDWGSSPAAIDACLQVCDQQDVQCTIHTDTLNEGGFLEQTLKALKGRVIHAYHTEGAGGGSAPDIIRICSFPHVIPSSTNPTRPFTVNTVDETFDMLVVCHHLNRDIPEDVAFAESRIRAETMGAEDYLQDLGAISIISSDSMAMGRIGEVILRTWQTAHKMKELYGELLPDQKSLVVNNDNFRVKRYIAKYTINPAVAHGLSHLVGSVDVGKLADLVLWEPAFFGVKPEVVIKGGVVTMAQMGDSNASIPSPQPSWMRPMFGASQSLVGGNNSNSISFVSKTLYNNSEELLSYGLKKRVEPVVNCREIGKADMKLNDCLPDIKVDPETFRVTVDGQLIEVPPAMAIPMSQSYFIT